MADPGNRREIPASLFGIVLGLGGMGNAWRAAHRAWALPSAIGEGFFFAAIAVWLILAVLYVHKWIVATEHARAELSHPIQCCFVGLIGVATTMIAGGVLPYSRHVALALFIAGGIYTVCFAAWRTGGLWQGDRDPAATTPVLYLPTVAGSFVIAAVAGAFGYVQLGQLAFGSGLFSWLAVESVLVHRLYTAPALAPALRPTLGIQLAPPTVGAVAYLGVTHGAPDILAHGMLGYGILQLLVLARLWPWIRRQPFAASYWAFSFGVSAVATAPLRMIERGDAGLIASLAACLFAGANVVIAVLIVATLARLFQGQLIARPAPEAAF